MSDRDLAAPSLAGKAEPVVITGGSGFIGSNLADSLLASGEEVVILDNLSRPGVDQNLSWLKENHGPRVHTLIADIRDLQAIEPAFADAKAVFHLAGQTAVTTSLSEPFLDFDVNARGTLNVLQAARRSKHPTPVIFASTNKVYGALDDLKLIEREDRYVPAAPDIYHHGIGEDRGLDFCTPYGCSKGAADQYVLDYAKSFDIPTAVLRMSCVYGPRQFGNEDQGWVAHFLIRALENQPITIYGDGKQVRDILHVRDAVAAYRTLLRSIDSVRGQAFNLGGGPANAVSLRHVLGEIAQITRRECVIEHADWRPADQAYFVADTRSLQRQLEWKATIAWRDGLRDLAAWLRSNRGLDAPLSGRERISA
ncbi:SDR family NAD(P)-dependent oxidoreductase [Phyllobacterium salinisoli]|nr:SDR family NAD(P)-dependent oxidoreductase [Phyllobacterium salinisoli]